MPLGQAQRAGPCPGAPARNPVPIHCTSTERGPCHPCYMAAAQPAPDRYRTPELQSAYEAGFEQMHDHNSFGFKEQMELAVDDLAQSTTVAETMAATLEGGADALKALANAARSGASLERALREADL
jgi:hypothetical protein